MTLHAREFAKLTVSAYEAEFGPLGGRVALVMEMADADDYLSAFVAEMEPRGVDVALWFSQVNVTTNFGHTFANSSGGYTEDINAVDTVVLIQPDGLNEFVVEFMLSRITGQGSRFHAVVAAPQVTDAVVQSLAERLPDGLVCSVFPIDREDGPKPRGAYKERAPHSIPRFVLDRIDKTAVVPAEILDGE